MTDIATKIITTCGGPRAVAEMLGIHVTTVFRFRRSREKGGSGGLIPSHHQNRLLAEARRRGIKLTPADFFEPALVEPLPPVNTDAGAGA